MQILEPNRIAIKRRLEAEKNNQGGESLPFSDPLTIQGIPILDSADQTNKNGNKMKNEKKAEKPVKGSTKKPGKPAISSSPKKGK